MACIDGLNPRTHEQMAAQAALARAYVISDVETQCPTAATSACGAKWRDVRPMLDPREHSPEVLDMHRLALQYGLDSGALVAHPQTPHLVRVAQR